MLQKLAFIAMLLVISPNIAYSACSRANLTRCLDSACAINMSSNPAARCQYCGTSDAGAPDAGGMRSVSVGSSTKYNISSRDLKSAPTDPGERYVWATKKCLDIVSDCTTDDVSDVYDPLIKQSCDAAGIVAEMSVLFGKVRETKTSTACDAEVTACIISNAKCTASYDGCATDADFDKYFSECSVLATGCDEYLSDIRSKLVSSRDTAIKNAETLLQSIVATYRETRTTMITNIRNSCTNNEQRNVCVSEFCAKHMPNRCDAAYPAETSMATQLCKFYDVACATIK